MLRYLLRGSMQQNFGVYLTLGWFKQDMVFEERLCHLHINFKGAVANSDSNLKVVGLRQVLCNNELGVLV